MAWNDKLKVPLMASGAAEGEHSLTFLYDYSNFHPFSVDCRQVVEQERTPPTSSINNNNQDRKRRMSWDQLESLERSFQEEIKLEPERKIKLAQELGLHPRKVAVWFQNRRARWKAKQLECLYESLKQEFNVVSREKLKLQEEVAKLKAKLDNKAIEIGASSKGLTVGNAEAEETMDSESAAISSSSTMLTGVNNNQIGNCQGVFNLVGDYNSSSLPYLGVLPGYPYTY